MLAFILLQTATGLTPEPTMENEIMSTLTAGAIAVSVIQWLKNTKLVPFINQNSAGLNRIVSWIAAFISGAGIHYTFNGDTGVLNVTGLTAGAIFHAAMTTTKQYAVQWLIYRGIISKQPVVAGSGTGTGEAAKP